MKSRATKRNTWRTFTAKKIVQKFARVTDKSPNNQLCHYQNVWFIAFSFFFMKSSEIVLKSHFSTTISLFAKKLNRRREFVLVAVRIFDAHYTNNTFTLMSQPHPSWESARLRAHFPYRRGSDTSKYPFSVLRCLVSVIWMFGAHLAFWLALTLVLSQSSANVKRNLVAKHSSVCVVATYRSTAEQRGGNCDSKVAIFLLRYG